MEIKVFQLLFVLKGIHAGPETLILVSHKLALCDETLERLLDQVFARLDVSKDVSAENKKASIHPNVRPAYIFEISNYFAL